MRLFRVAIIIALVAMGLRAFDLQILRGHQYQKAASLQLRTTVPLPAVRGGIYDRNGAVLAMSVPTKEIIADDFQIVHPVQESLALAPLLGMPAMTLEPMLQRHSGYVILTQHLSTSRASTVTSDNFPGITMVDTATRTVPNATLASSVLGVTNAQGSGAAGLEYQYNQLLAGSAGSESLLETPYGVTLPQGGALKTKPAVAGRGIELTLDQPLQYVTEQALAAEISASGAISGTAIVMDTRTGQILSMANLVSTVDKDAVLPSPLASSADTGIPGIAQAQNNLAVTQTYEPGSVFKLVTFAAALTSGQITPSSAFSVPGSVTVDGSVFHDAESHGTESLSAADILAQSSNIGTYEIANQLGEASLLAEVEQLGFGQPTGMNFPGESEGLLMTAAGWEPTDMASLPIGQVDAATPLQVLDAYNAVANGGVFVDPSLVRATVDASGQLHSLPASSSRRALEPSVAETLKNMLEGVVTSGTGAKAAIPGYLIAGKTGTAAIPTPGLDSYLVGAYNASFVGFAPAENPVLSAIVVLQRPEPDFYGGDVAAPVFAKIMSYALHRYGIPTSSGGSGAQTAAASRNSVKETT
jgi:cell division protein FtsI (penicillin-binding protein 3)